MHRAADHASLRKDLISAIASDVVGVLASSLWSTRSTAMRAVVLLVLTLISLAFSHLAQAETEPGRIVLAQRILSCGEQANTLYLQYTAFKCNTRAPSQPDKCKPLMDNIYAIAARCERAKVFCVR
jgi:uncharacterized membrane protein YoaK (UPF0700 family)